MRSTEYCLCTEYIVRPISSMEQSSVTRGCWLPVWPRWLKPVFRIKPPATFLVFGPIHGAFSTWYTCDTRLKLLCLKLFSSCQSSTATDAITNLAIRTNSSSACHYLGSVPRSDNTVRFSSAEPPSLFASFTIEQVFVYDNDNSNSTHSLLSSADRLSSHHHLSL